MVCRNFAWESVRPMPKIDTISLSLTIVRIAVAATMIIHGAARMFLGIVGAFGNVLGQWGFPAGHAIAWTITIVEIVGGLLLAAGFFVRPLCVWFGIQLLMGIYLIHWKAGWFTVGAGRNGMEFSVVLIACLLAIALSAKEVPSLFHRS